mmetsp:Transcript_16219/g.30672  ORF Transcript_16219/g.30672 Transcript_16219/m.30672 type:complete len:88 (-) Transcript_16219:2084-2347(-)
MGHYHSSLLLLLVYCCWVFLVVAQHVCSFVTCFSPAVVPNTSIRSISNNNRGAIGRGGGKTILGGGGEGGGGEKQCDGGPNATTWTQ